MSVRRRIAFVLTVAVVGLLLVIFATGPVLGSASDDDGNRVAVRARGNTGEETLVLSINGDRVRSWPVSSRNQTFAFSYDGPIDVLRVSHDDGGWPSALIVDHVEINGTVWESEDPSVFSYGSWDPVSRCAAGHKRSEWISCPNGFLQFRPGTPGPTTTVPATTSTTTSTSWPATTSPTTTVPTTSPTTAPPTTTTTPPTTSAPTTSRPRDPGAFESIRNRQAKFTRYADVPESQIPLSAPLTQSASRPDNGPYGDGRSAAFRIYCEYSHFSHDDPIVHPGRPGASHLHTFFGNTEADAFSTGDSLSDSGGGTCSGFELNRSAYWVPSLLDGRGNVIVPDQIVVYYKTKNAAGVQPLPQGLALVGGNITDANFQNDKYLLWSCGPSGRSYNQSNRIPNCNGDVINASIAFPSCWDGVNLSSADHQSHMRYWEESRPCPSSHPVRLPDITVLLYYPGFGSVDGFHLSSDRPGSLPGGTLHADWLGGWNEEAQDLWFNGCMRRARNCSGGQTGTSQMLAKLNGLDVYEGENVLPLPPGVTGGHGHGHG